MGGEEAGGLRDEKSGAARGQAGPVAACGRGAGARGDGRWGSGAWVEGVRRPPLGSLFSHTGRSARVLMVYLNIDMPISFTKI